MCLNPLEISYSHIAEITLQAGPNVIFTGFPSSTSIRCQCETLTSNRMDFLFSFFWCVHLFSLSRLVPFIDSVYLRPAVNISCPSCRHWACELTVSITNNSAGQFFHKAALAECVGGELAVSLHSNINIVIMIIKNWGLPWLTFFF